ncbi:MAG: ureidoglycolate lyase [Ahrensia sp.]|nr:ureidoglycolate lyase [Ahrensia sp.]
MNTIRIEPLTAAAFRPYGDVIEKGLAQEITINRGKCVRHHALALADVTGEGARVAINIFAGQPYDLPHKLDLVERHPLGSQAFYPLGGHEWLAIVCEDDDGVPVSPRAFLASPDQGINLNRDQWHGVLTPLHAPCDFLVVDRAGPGDNLEEHLFDTPWTVQK